MSTADREITVDEAQRAAAPWLGYHRALPLLQIGIDFRSAPLEAFGRQSLAQVPDLLERLRSVGVTELALLATCNRSELYAFGGDVDAAEGRLRSEFTSGGAVADGQVLARRGTDGVRHLIAVAAGLESALVGETEVLGQVRAAYRDARRIDTVRGPLARLFEHAVAYARRVRRVLGRDPERRSLMTLTTCWVAERTPDPSRANTIVVGTGEAARQTLQSLRALDFRPVTVVSRALQRADELARTVGATAATLERLPLLLADADIAVFATATATPLLRAAQVAASRNGSGRALLIADLGVPPNVAADVADFPYVQLLGMDMLVQRATRLPQPSRATGDEIAATVSEGAAKFVDWYDRRLLAARRRASADGGDPFRQREKRTGLAATRSL